MLQAPRLPGAGPAFSTSWGQSHHKPRRPVPSGTVRRPQVLAPGRSVHHSPPPFEGLCGPGNSRAVRLDRFSAPRVPRPLVPNSGRRRAGGGPSVRPQEGGRAGGTHSPPGTWRRLGRAAHEGACSRGARFPQKGTGRRLRQRPRPSPPLVGGRGANCRRAGQAPPGTPGTPCVRCQVALHAAASPGFPASSRVRRGKPGPPGSPPPGRGRGRGSLCGEERAFLGCAFRTPGASGVMRGQEAVRG